MDVLACLIQMNFLTFLKQHLKQMIALFFFLEFMKRAEGRREGFTLTLHKYKAIERNHRNHLNVLPDMFLSDETQETV